MTLDAHHEAIHSQRKFEAALQGVDLDSGEEEKEAPPTWEDIKARVYSGGKAKDSKDILSLVGQTAKDAGIGIGNGLAYVDESSTTEWWKL
jgi:hypothetical protein